nr:hypothetical protein [Streptomyces sp. DSM 41633]
MEVDVLGDRFRVRLRQIRSRAVELEDAEVQASLMGGGAGLRCGEKRGWPVPQSRRTWRSSSAKQPKRDAVPVEGNKVGI